MRVPKKLVICGQDFKVAYKKKLFVGKTECWGICDQEKHIIYLRYGMENTRKMEILLHECIHAVENIHNIRISEKGVKELGVSLTALIRNNKLNFLC